MLNIHTLSHFVKVFNGYFLKSGSKFGHFTKIAYN